MGKADLSTKLLLCQAVASIEQNYIGNTCLTNQTSRLDLEDLDFPPEGQFEFRKQHSAQQILRLVQYATEVITRNLFTGIIIFDMAKVFYMMI